MRRLLVLILCLLLPLQGFASVQGVAAPCPMQAMMDLHGDAGAMGDTMEDCCNDAAAFKLTGKVCKTGQSCVVPMVGMPSDPDIAFQVQPAQQLQAPAWHPPPPGSTTRLWRPPTSV